MPRDLITLRKIGIIAHIDAGKTTVTERMLYLSGAKHRVGAVDSGTTETDSDPEEQQRGITIYAACVTFPWKDITVNLLDTPGHVDFTAEVERCLRVLDGAVVVFSDREGADFESVFEEMSSRLGAHPIAIQIPVGQGPPHVANPFRGVLDLIEMKLLTFPIDKDAREYSIEEIPADLQDEAEVWRHEM